jgi:hypothetical protein
MDAMDGGRPLPGARSFPPTRRPMRALGARRSAGPPCPLRLRENPFRSPVRDPRNGRLHPSRIHHEGHEEHEGRVAAMPASRVPSPEPSCAVRLERRSDLPVPSSCPLLLRVLRALRGEIRIAGATAGPGRTGSASACSRLFSHRGHGGHGGRVVNPPPRRVRPGGGHRVREGADARLPDAAPLHSPPRTRRVRLATVSLHLCTSGGDASGEASMGTRPRRERGRGFRISPSRPSGPSRPFSPSAPPPPRAPRRRLPSRLNTPSPRCPRRRAAGRSSGR